MATVGAGHLGLASLAKDQVATGPGGFGWLIPTGLKFDCSKASKAFFFEEKKLKTAESKAFDSAFTSVDINPDILLRNEFEKRLEGVMNLEPVASMYPI